MKRRDSKDAVMQGSRVARGNRGSSRLVQRPCPGKWDFSQQSPAEWIFIDNKLKTSQPDPSRQFHFHSTQRQTSEIGFRLRSKAFHRLCRIPYRLPGYPGLARHSSAISNRDGLMCARYYLDSTRGAYTKWTWPTTSQGWRGSDLGGFHVGKWHEPLS